MATDCSDSRKANLGQRDYLIAKGEWEAKNPGQVYPVKKPPKEPAVDGRETGKCSAQFSLEAARRKPEPVPENRHDIKREPGSQYPTAATVPANQARNAVDAGVNGM